MAFWQLKPIKPIENKVILSHQISPELLYFDAAQTQDSQTLQDSVDYRAESDELIAIKLTVVNPTNQAYSSDNYYYRVVINRSYPESPGFIIKDFSKDLAAGGQFDEDFTWQRLESYMPNEDFKFRIHFNMYKRNGINEPTLIASSTKLLKVTASAK